MEFYRDSSSVSIDVIEANAVFSDIYKFFGIIIAMRSDREDTLGWFRNLYSRFRQEDTDGKVDATYYMMVEMLGEPFVVSEENSHLRIRSADDECSAMLYAYLLAGNYLADNLKSHFLIHAAAVSWDGDGLAVVGASCYGKTSLTLQLLLRNGFRFLSDDQLAINRTTYLIDPFPRGVGVRENTLALFHELDLKHLETYVDSDGQRKWFADISEISKYGVEESCRLKYIVFLVDSLDEMEKDERQIGLTLTLDDVNDELLEELRSMARNGEIHCRYMGSFYAVSLQLAEERSAALEIDHLCKDCGVRLLGVREFSNAKPDFSLTPRIQPISWRVAVMELLKGLQNDFRRTPIPTFLELAEMLEDVECYKLSVGKLDEMGENICNLMQN